MRKSALVLALLLLAWPLQAGGRGSDSHTAKVVKPYKPKKVKIRKVRPPAVRCVGCPANSTARPQPNPHARRDFRRVHPCPATGKTKGRCPGWVIDHIVPLRDGGLDDPANMQWRWTPIIKPER
jgi:hypothetical protein